MSSPPSWCFRFLEGFLATTSHSSTDYLLFRSERLGFQYFNFMRPPGLPDDCSTSFESNPRGFRVRSDFGRSLLLNESISPFRKQAEGFPLPFPAYPFVLSYFLIVFSWNLVFSGLQRQHPGFSFYSQPLQNPLRLSRVFFELRFRESALWRLSPSPPTSLV